MMFVKLTYRYSDEAEPEPLFLRADSITAMHRTWVADDDEGTNRMEITRVTAAREEYWVRETPNEIYKLIRYALTEGQF